MSDSSLALLATHAQSVLTSDLEVRLKGFIQQAISASYEPCQSSLQRMERLDQAWRMQRLLWQLRQSSISA
jgi:hypothetical protein